MVPVAAALETVLRAVRPLGIERVAITDALGRIIARDVIATRDLPPWDNSSVDGYAVVAADLGGATSERPVALTVGEEIAAGRMPEHKVAPGTAARIMTGAPMPVGADAVVMVEDTTPEGDRVLIRTSVERDEAVRARGQDVRAGAVVIPAGRRARAAEIGMLASLGCAAVAVGRRPRVGILATGDELADLGEAERPDRIFNVNSYAIAAQVAEAGGTAQLLGIARDRPDDLRDHLRRLDGLDVLIVCGGVSVGKFDFVKDVLTDLGMTMDFWRVAMKPGSPMAFGSIRERPVFGLPGNPVSSMVTFEVFVRPALLRMAGATELGRPVATAELTESIHKARGKTHFVRGRLAREGEHTLVTPTGSQDSGILTSMVRADGLIVLAQDVEGVERGRQVEVRLLQGDARD
ncbi:MAG: molybdopterin molybdotransferase MoeA [Nitrospirae bacterium]|nr:molybdopterin molybdotransferase MoeA [Nitrospirota bacterium]